MTLVPSIASVVLAAASLLAAAAAQELDRYATWRLHEVAHTQSRGGSCWCVSISADATRMLSLGECGDLIEWDLVAARERRRFAAAGNEVVECIMHPHDPWAVVIVGWRSPHAFRLDFGSSRYTKLWNEEVRTVAFDACGARAAVVFCDPMRGSRLAVYAEAALRAARPPAPDFERPISGWPKRVFFHPQVAAVFAGSSSTTWRVPLDGRGPVQCTNDGLCGFLTDGTEVRETRDRWQPRVAGMHWLCGHGKLERGGVEPARWEIAGPYGSAAIATDGTVVAPNDHGDLLLLGPEAGRRRSVCGHDGAALQLCFDAGNHYLAITGGNEVAILDAVSGASERFAGSFAVHGLATAGEFAAFDGHAVRRIRAGAPPSPATQAVLPAGVTATAFEREWTGLSLVRPFLWQREGVLWLTDGRLSGDDRTPLRIVNGVATPLPALARGPKESRYQRGVAFAAGRSGDMLCATATPPVQCGNGLRGVEYWSTVRVHCRDGELRKSRAFGENIDWLRTSPTGSLAAVPWTNGVLVLAASDLHTIHEIRDLALRDACIVAFEFIDERTALASDGTRLLQVRLAAGIARPIELPPLRGPITRLCLSSDRSLVALACRDDVRVFRRE